MVQLRRNRLRKKRRPARKRHLRMHEQTSARRPSIGASSATPIGSPTKARMMASMAATSSSAVMVRTFMLSSLCPAYTETTCKIQVPCYSAIVLVGASPVQLTPIGKLKSKHTKAPPRGRLFSYSVSRSLGCALTAFGKNFGAQSVTFPVPTRRTMTRILSGRGPMIATSPVASIARRMPHLRRQH